MNNRNKMVSILAGIMAGLLLFGLVSGAVLALL